ELGVGRRQGLDRPAGPAAHRIPDPARRRPDRIRAVTELLVLAAPRATFTLGALRSAQRWVPVVVEGFPMSRRRKRVGAVLWLLAVVSITAWPVWKWLHPKPVSAALYERTKAVVEKNPHLKPDWDKAMEDGVLTWREANAILEKVGEKAGPED